MSIFLNKRRLLLLLIDLLIFTGSYSVSYLISQITPGFTFTEVEFILNLTVFVLCVFAARFILRIYMNVWRYANSKAYLELVISDAIGGTLAIILTMVIPGVGYFGGWRSIAFLAVANCLTLVSRFVYQQFHKYGAEQKAMPKDAKITVAIVGAGQVGSLLGEELISFRGSHYRPVFFIDSNEDKVGSRVCGLPVLREDDAVFKQITEYRVQEIFIAIPQLTGEEAQRKLDYYAKTGCKVKLYDFLHHGETSSAQSEKRVIREFKIEDLLFRNALNVTNEETKAFYEGKVVLVTGGGGSIGSELSRQIAKCSPKKLIIFDIYENNAYDIQQELIRKYGEKLDLAVEIGSVRDRNRLECVFRNYRPDIVFHAAAHKHVPLMEHSNVDAIKNNVLGTYNTADMAEKYGVKKFILVSTDKAVNPTNVMGATKRMCEMIIQCRRDSATAFSAVRFGNVLGSNGSVIPLFKRQIMAGGPITITDKRIIRYFMTIPEASGLVMQAGAMAKCGELFVLDMGKPVKIYDLAENMIKLSGLVPHVDIEIVETGLRPGEKLYEELLIKTESLIVTDNKMIFIEKDTPLTREEIDERIAMLKRVVVEREGEIEPKEITEALKLAVPTFHSPEEVNASAEKSDEMQMANAE